MPTVTIDNREIEVPAGTKVIEAAERLGIMIPRFCFHPALGSVGACRVCAVAFREGPVKGIQMSCMTDIQDGMVVSTTDPEAVDFRRHVIEWLMLNHPHDCPVCDEGGHCLLQDMTVSGGHGLRRYRGPKRTHRDQNLGPLVQHEMNRCIQCYRCARYYQEFSGYRDLGVLGIGSRVYFGRSRPGALESPFAGNLIDICPTGVYTDKPSRFVGRRWDFQRQPSLCLHCSLGCNLVVSARYRRVVRHEARCNDDVNGYFICDRGRYGYDYAGAADRPHQASAAGEPADTAGVIAAARARLQQASAQWGPRAVAVATSPYSSLETLAVVRQACRQNGWTGPAVVDTNRQAHTLQTAVGRLAPELAVSLAAVAQADEVLVAGADPLNESPMLALCLRQAQRRGGHVTVIDPRGVEMPLEFDHWAAHPSQLEALLRALADALAPGERPSPPNGAAAASAARFPVADLARRLAGSRRAVVVCGTDITTAREAAAAADLARALRRADVDAGLFYTLVGANAFGAALAGDRVRSFEQVLEGIEAGGVKALVVVERDMWRDYPDRRRLSAALKMLDHLIVLGYLPSPLNQAAGHFIPTRTVYESGGLWINQEGRLQAARAVLAPGEPIDITGAMRHPPRAYDRRVPGDDTPAAWQALADLALETDTEATDTRQQLAACLAAFHPALGPRPEESAGGRIALEACAGSPPADPPGNPAADGLTLMLVERTVGTEALSALAPALNAAAPEPTARLHPDEIARRGLTGQESIRVTASGALVLRLEADARMAPGVIVIPRHHRLQWQFLGAARQTLDAAALGAPEGIDASDGGGK